MKKMILILVILITLTNAVYAFNGVDWKGLDNYPDRAIAKLYKTLLVRGIYEGVGYASSDIEFNKVFFIKPVGEGEGFFGNLVDELDKFYSDGRNINIIIPDALLIISCELKGEKQYVIEDTTVRL